MLQCPAREIRIAAIPIAIAMTLPVGGQLQNDGIPVTAGTIFRRLCLSRLDMLALESRVSGGCLQCPGPQCQKYRCHLTTHNTETMDESYGSGQGVNHRGELINALFGIIRDAETLQATSPCFVRVYQK